MRGIVGRIAAVLTSMILLVSCTSSVIQPVRLDPARPASIESQKFVDVKTTDGRTIRVYEPELDQDRLRGFNIIGRPIEIEYASIQSAAIMTRKTDSTKTILLIGGIIVLAAGVLLMMELMQDVQEELDKITFLKRR